MKTNTHFLSYLAHIFTECEMFQTKLVEKIKTHILCSVTFFSPENRVVYDITWKNIVVRGRPQMTVWRKRIARWIPEATNTHTGFVILITFLLHRPTRQK